MTQIAQDLKALINEISDVMRHNRGNFMIGWQNEKDSQSAHEAVWRAQLKLQDAQEILIDAFQRETNLTDEELLKQGVFHG